uniref:O-antigen ligase family protein n=1 Tax=Phenylobacterium glaciei TaxID=2803784 RepID=A0A974P6F6_9CAUL|nr:O-antigen ligase family protein [Phenylobacterium glaciei]
MLGLAVYFFTNLRWAHLIARIAVISSALSAIVLYFVFNSLNSTNFGALLIRSNDVGGKLGVGTGRNYIWRAVFHELSQPKSEHFFGYGYYGDLKTHLSSEYAWVFQGTKHSTSYHNTFLQYTLESGYFSAVLFSLYCGRRRVDR